MTADRGCMSGASEAERERLMKAVHAFASASHFAGYCDGSPHASAASAESAERVRCAAHADLLGVVYGIRVADVFREQHGMAVSS